MYTGPIVDLRIRPPFLHRFFGSTPGTPECDVVRWLNGRVGSNDPDHFMRVKNSADLLAEMDAARITTGVVVARSVPNVRVTNDDVARVAAADRRRLLAVALVDPQQLGLDAAIAEVRRAVTELGCRAVNVDPGFRERPLQADDALLFPIYLTCQNSACPRSSCPDPRRWTSATPNRARSRLSRWHFRSCQSSPVIEAANGFMSEQLLFGSAYPFKPMKQAVEQFLQAGLRVDVIDRIIHGDTALLLGIEAPP